VVNKKREWPMPHLPRRGRFLCRSSPKPGADLSTVPSRPAPAPGIPQSVFGDGDRTTARAQRIGGGVRARGGGRADARFAGWVAGVGGAVTALRETFKRGAQQERDDEPNRRRAWSVFPAPNGDQS
jgi:hypothetical protein